MNNRPEGRPCVYGKLFKRFPALAGRKKTDKELESCDQSEEWRIDGAVVLR